MFRSDSQTAVKTLTGQPPLGSLTVAAGSLAAGLTVLCLAAGTPVLVTLFIFAAVLVLIVQGLVHHYPHRDLGLCNVITLARVAMVAFLAGAVSDQDVSVWIVFSVATVAFALDGLDGVLARRSGLVSDFGARFDMETDAALGAVLALCLLLTDGAGPEILILGFMRYGFVLAGLMMPALRAELPQSLRRKTICVVQISALIFLLFPASRAGLMLPVSVGAALLLTWSFAVDVVWLLRRAP